MDRSRRLATTVHLAIGATLASICLVSHPYLLAAQEPPVNTGKPKTSSLAAATIRKRQAQLSTRIRREPSIDALVQQMLKPHQRQRQAVSDTIRDAHHSGWVPELRLGVDYDQGQDLSESSDADTSIRLSSDQGLGFDATLTFRFNRVVFHPAEVSLLRERRQRDALRDRHIDEAIKLFYRRHRLLAEIALGKAPLGPKHNEVAAIEARLNHWTRGWYREQLLKLKTQSSSVTARSSK